MRKRTEPVEVERPPHKPVHRSRGGILTSVQPILNLSYPGYARSVAHLHLCVVPVPRLLCECDRDSLTPQCVLTVFAVALKDKYGLNELQIGLCYLPSGVGSILSSLINGRQLDYFFRREERRVGGDYRTHKEFRIEITRIRWVGRERST